MLNRDLVSIKPVINDAHDDRMAEMDLGCNIHRIIALLHNSVAILFRVLVFRSYGFIYFRATLGVKEVLQSSKFSTFIFYGFRFYITPTF